jgi:hypothetical protein
MTDVNMSFEKLNNLIQEQFSLMCSTGKLFISSINGDELWNTYLNSFNPKEIFRDPESSVDNCNKDKAFIRAFGNVVALDSNNNIITMFDIIVEGTRYEYSIVNMRSALINAPIKGVFNVHYEDLLKLPYEKTSKTQELYQLGYKPSYKQYTKEEVDKFGVVEEGKVYTFYHFCVSIPKRFVLFSNESLSAHYGNLNTSHEIFLKGLSIPLETLQVVRDLMIQESLLRAEIYQSKVEQFLSIKQEYESLTDNKLNWTWKKFQDIPFARFANELIGTTCIDLAEGKDINKVCKDFNYRVDPANYSKAKAPITQAQIDAATKRIVELGYENSFKRRFATVDDINSGSTINEIIYTGANNIKPSTKGTLFANVKPSAPKDLSRHKKAEFDKVEEVSIETFLENILPGAKSIEVLLENSFSNNLVTMTTSNDKECKPLFKWSNPFSWTYNGNLAGKSFIKEAVKSAGGNVEGVLRSSLVWNESGSDKSDLDVWCQQPNGETIYFDTYFRKDRGGKLSSCGGQLDLDVIYPDSKLAVENIYFESLSKLKQGMYRFHVNPYTRNNSQGFKFEIEFDGNTFNYEYNQPVRDDVHIAEVMFDGISSFSIKHLLEPVSSSVKDLWNLSTNQFHKVNLMCLSPNYWGNNAIGNKHYFFFLDGCHSDVPMRSFHIENLNGELLQDRKVLEVFGMTDKLEPSDKQLAGLGFTNDSKETLVVKVEGSFKRTVRIRF